MTAKLLQIWGLCPHKSPAQWARYWILRHKKREEEEQEEQEEEEQQQEEEDREEGEREPHVKQPLFLLSRHFPQLTVEETES